MKTKSRALVIIWLSIGVLTSLFVSPLLALAPQQQSSEPLPSPEPPSPHTEAQPPPGWQPDSTRSRSIQVFGDLAPVTNPRDWPYSAVTRLSVTWPSGRTGTCSGILIDPRHVLTAGHCVFDYNDPERHYEPCPNSESCWASAIEVIPAYESGDAPFGTARMISPMSWTKWTGPDRDHAHDMGVIYLDRPVGALTGWYGYGAADPIFFLDNIFRNSGYPGTPFHDGQQMWTREGSFDTSGIYQAGHINQSYSGQSGSGYAYRYNRDQDLWRVYAVTAYYSQETNLSTVTYCPKITYFDGNTGKLADIIKWIDSHTPSQPDLVPLNVEVKPASIESGQETFASLLLHNYSSTNWTGTMSIDLYLSTDDTISTADERIYAGSYQGSIGAKSWIRWHIPEPLTPPDDGGSIHYIGALVNAQDADTSNNATVGWDTAQITITQPKLKVYVPYVIR